MIQSVPGQRSGSTHRRGGEVWASALQAGRATSLPEAEGPWPPSGVRRAGHVRGQASFQDRVGNLSPQPGLPQAVAPESSQPESPPPGPWEAQPQLCSHPVNPEQSGQGQGVGAAGSGRPGGSGHALAGPPCLEASKPCWAPSPVGMRAAVGQGQESQPRDQGDPQLLHLRGE